MLIKKLQKQGNYPAFQALPDYFGRMDCAYNYKALCVETENFLFIYRTAKLLAEYQFFCSKPIETEYFFMFILLQNEAFLRLFF